MCNCKHYEYCKIKDKENCILVNDPWVVPDNKIMGMSTLEINQKQGRNFDLKGSKSE